MAAASAASVAVVSAPAPADPAATPAPASATVVMPPTDLLIPVVGVPRSALRDSFYEGRPGHVHEAIDIMAARGTPVRAVDAGRIAKLFTSKPGGLTVYQFDRSGTFAYYYAHLDRYADGLAQGQPVERGQTLGYVGSTGDASPDAPHLHFTIFRLGPEKRWWEGEAINPYPLLTDPGP